MPQFVLPWNYGLIRCGICVINLRLIAYLTMHMFIHENSTHNSISYFIIAIILLLLS